MSLNIFLPEYDDFFKMHNRACSQKLGTYDTMKEAMSGCSDDDPCVVVDDQCDNINQFSRCRFKDLIESNDDTCIYFKPATGLFCF